MFIPFDSLIASTPFFHPVNFPLPPTRCQNSHKALRGQTDSLSARFFSERNLSRTKLFTLREFRRSLQTIQ
jgi:hypothetical protein